MSSTFAEYGLLLVESIIALAQTGGTALRQSIITRIVEWQHEAIDRAVQYATANRREVVDRLGQGYDGVVLGTAQGTAIKSFAFERLYRRELAVYHRLQEHQADDVHGFAVPALVQFDDQLWIVEMEVVSPPFVLDFAGAYLDEPPDYPADVMAAWEADKCEQFGQERCRTA